MKKLLNYKSELGSVSLYALVAMLILLTILLSLYIYNAQKQAQNLEVTKQIKNIYEKDVNNIDNVYNNLVLWFENNGRNDNRYDRKDYI